MAFRNPRNRLKFVESNWMHIAWMCKNCCDFKVTKKKINFKRTASSDKTFPIKLKLN